MPDVIEWQPAAAAAPRVDEGPVTGGGPGCVVPAYDPHYYPGPHPYMYPYYAAASALQAAYAATTKNMKCLNDIDRTMNANERWVLLNKETFHEIFDATLDEMTCREFVRRPPPPPLVSTPMKAAFVPSQACVTERRPSGLNVPTNHIPCQTSHDVVISRFNDKVMPSLIDVRGVVGDDDTDDDTEEDESKSEEDDEEVQMGDTEHIEPLDLSTHRRDGIVDTSCREEHRLDPSMDTSPACCSPTWPGMREATHPGMPALTECWQCMESAVREASLAVPPPVCVPGDPSHARRHTPRGSLGSQQHCGSVLSTSTCGSRQQRAGSCSMRVGRSNTDTTVQPAACYHTHGMRKGGGGGRHTMENWVPLSKAKVYDLIDEVMDTNASSSHPQDLRICEDNQWSNGAGPRGRRSTSNTPPRSPTIDRMMAKRSRTLSSQNNNNNTYNYGTVMKVAGSDQSLSPRCASQNDSIVSHGQYPGGQMMGHTPDRRAAPANKTSVKQCWVALNKMVVFDIVDSAISRENTKDGSLSPDEESQPGPQSHRSERPPEGAALSVHGKILPTHLSQQQRQQQQQQQQPCDKNDSCGSHGSPKQPRSHQGAPNEAGSREGSFGTNLMKDVPPILEPVPTMCAYLKEDTAAGRRKRSHSLTAEMESGGYSKKYKDLGVLMHAKTSTPPPNIRDLTCKHVSHSNVQQTDKLVYNSECVKSQSSLLASKPTTSPKHPTTLLNSFAPIDLACRQSPSSPSAIKAAAVSPRGSPNLTHRGRSQPCSPGRQYAGNKDAVTQSASMHHLGQGQRYSIDPATNQKCAAKQENIKGVHAATPLIRSPSSMSENNQCAPGGVTDSANKTSKGLTASDRASARSPHLPARSEVGVLSVTSAQTAGTDDSRDSSRASPRLGWIAVSKAEVHTIVDSVVEKMMLDDISNGHTDNQSVPSFHAGQQISAPSLSNTPSPTSSDDTASASHQRVSSSAEDALMEEDGDQDSDGGDIEHGLVSPGGTDFRKKGPFKWKSTLLERVHEENRNGSPPPTPEPVPSANSSKSNNSSAGSKLSSDHVPSENRDQKSRGHKRQARPQKGNSNSLAKVK